MAAIISPTQTYVDPSIKPPQQPLQPGPPPQPLAGPEDPNARLAVAPRMKARANAQASAGAWTPQATANGNALAQALMSPTSVPRGPQPPTVRQAFGKLMRGY